MRGRRRSGWATVAAALVVCATTALLAPPLGSAVAEAPRGNETVPRLGQPIVHVPGTKSDTVRIVGPGGNGDEQVVVSGPEPAPSRQRSAAVVDAATGTGVISGRVTLAGTPIPAQVAVATFEPWEWVASTNAGDDGRYQVTVPAGGPYYVSFFYRDYPQLWWRDAWSDYLGDPVRITSGQILSGINATMDLPGVITGRVVGDRVGLPNVAVHMLRRIDDHTSYGWTAWTQADGSYRFRNLPKGGPYELYFYVDQAPGAWMTTSFVGVKTSVRAGEVSTVPTWQASPPTFLRQAHPDVEAELLRLVNQARSQGRRCGTTWMPPAAPLALSTQLLTAARSHTSDMAARGYFAHDTQFSSVMGRILASGIRNEYPAEYTIQAAFGWGENIASGYLTAQDVMAGWLDSPGHCRNLMDADWTHMGGALAKADGDAPSYWTQDFARIQQPADVPGSPRAPVATAAAHAAVVRWTPAGFGADYYPALIPEFRVVASPGGATCTTGYTLGCTITGLTPGIAYTVRVQARNAAGWSDWSPISNPVTPTETGPPNPPRSVTVTRGDEAALVRWDPPTGTAPARYQVATDPTSPGCTTTTTTCRLTGLTNGWRYAVDVRAINAAGRSAAAIPLRLVTPLGLPRTPTHLTGQPGDTAVALAWTAPADGGSDIDAYKVRVITGGRQSDVIVNFSKDGNGTIHAVVEELRNGTTYQLHVAARNEVGWGPWSAPVTVTPREPYPPVTAATVNGFPGPRQARIEWQARGTGVTGVRVHPFDRAPVHLPATTTGYTVTEVPTGRRFSADVVAIYSTGESDPVTVRWRQAQPPSAVRLLRARRTRHRVSVTWRPPSRLGGAPVLGYQLRTKACRRPVTAWRSMPATRRSVIVRGATCAVQVRARNSQGRSPSSRVVIRPRR